MARDAGRRARPLLVLAHHRRRLRLAAGAAHAAAAASLGGDLIRELRFELALERRVLLRRARGGVAATAKLAHLPHARHQRRLLRLRRHLGAQLGAQCRFELGVLLDVGARRVARARALAVGGGGGRICAAGGSCIRGDGGVAGGVGAGESVAMLLAALDCELSDSSAAAPRSCCLCHAACSPRSRCSRSPRAPLEAPASACRSASTCSRSSTAARPGVRGGTIRVGGKLLDGGCRSGGAIDGR